METIRSTRHRLFCASLSLIRTQLLEPPNGIIILALNSQDPDSLALLYDPCQSIDPLSLQGFVATLAPDFYFPV